MIVTCSGSVVYGSISGAIEEIVNSFVHVKGVHVPDMDSEDIGQEIRIKCWEAINSSGCDISRLQASLPSLYSYLRTSVHNYIYNLNRGVTVPNNGPCSRCNLWDKLNRRCSGDPDTCEKMKKYKKTMGIKLALKNPIGYDIQYIESNRVNNEQIIDIDQYILNEYVVQNLPNDYKFYYKKACEGDYVPEEIMEEMQEIVVNILSEKEE